jgi:hypothetical protein
MNEKMLIRWAREFQLAIEDGPKHCQGSCSLG